MIGILYTLGWIMTLVGGLLLMLFGFAAALGIFWLIFYPVFALGALFWGIIVGIMGLICAVSARFVHHLGTAILVLLIGIAASFLGIWFVAWLLIIGAILGIVSRL